MWSSDVLKISARVVGDRGELRALNPIMPSSYTESVRSANSKRLERFTRRASYAYQLDAFAAAVVRGETVKTRPEDAVENMTAIDAMYRAAGLLLREPS
ncbi:Putative dehydrogenase (fragment) [uncultured Mycobacterium sp.]|uniref:Gfo/Idh/MocA-like oxidoreductase C-terminal domain-containing protein n=2 Tax=Mycobacteriaceae TaxID=1762 RepID=A0A064C9Z2_9MYCO